MKRRPCPHRIAVTNLPFGEYYPHTRWVDQETPMVQIGVWTPSIIDHSGSFPRRTVSEYGGKS